ncbi:lipase family protein [Dermatobacter hominis]|uniref:lipase family protein n=1 Tax=Dermatobacter hominis TaxID=2884263 RepID=UPI001D12D7D3|nr:lipase family protein [Dermatobacter hominis]UDY35077.1 lipase family protein [Dermatobacter hominis]
MSRSGPVRRWSAAVAALVALGVVAACAPPPPDAGFSDPPADLSVERPGQVIRSRPWTYSTDATTQAGVPGIRATQVLYRSTDALGAPIAVSGTVLVPERPWTGPGPRPLVSYAVGTHGVSDDCAPSKLMAQGLEYESGTIQRLLDLGWAVAVTDMEGLGTPGLHTYVVGRSEGHAVLDMARAALALPATGVPPDAPVGIMGYSQGGGSAAWAAELAPTYAPELHLVGVAAGGTVADPLAIARADEGTPWIGLVLLTALGFDAAYPELDLDSYLNETGRAMAEDGRRFCIMSLAGIATLVDAAGTSTGDYVTDVNPLDTPAWQQRLRENTLGGAAPSVPVLMQHGYWDGTVPYPQAEQLRATWCAAGADVTWRTLFGEHVLGFVLAAEPAVAFLADRFAGRPAPDGCSEPRPG